MAARARRPSPVSILRNSGSSQFQYRLEMKPGTHTRLMRSLTEDLIGDRDVAVMRVMHFRPILHRQPPPADCPTHDHWPPGHLRTDPPHVERRNLGADCPRAQ